MGMEQIPYFLICSAAARAAASAFFALRPFNLEPVPDSSTGMSTLNYALQLFGSPPWNFVSSPNQPEIRLTLNFTVVLCSSGLDRGPLFPRFSGSTTSTGWRHGLNVRPFIKSCQPSKSTVWPKIWNKLNYIVALCIRCDYIVPQN